MQNRFYKV